MRQDSIFYANIISQSLMDVYNSITKSEFVFNYEGILIDEEYLNTNKEFLKCFSCDSEKIVKKTMDVETFKSFVTSIFDDSENRIYWLNIIDALYTSPYLSENISYFTVEYCEDCKTILRIDDNLFFIRYDFSQCDEIEMLIKDGFINSDGAPLKCMYCKSTKTEEKNVYYGSYGAEEYDVCCKDCGKILGHWAYGSYCF